MAVRLALRVRVGILIWRCLTSFASQAFLNLNFHGQYYLDPTISHHILSLPIKTISITSIQSFLNSFNRKICLHKKETFCNMFIAFLKTK